MARAISSFPEEDVGYFGFLALSRRVSAVTAACMALRRSVYLEVGGFDEINLPVAFNDVDLCLRIGSRGYAVIGPLMLNSIIMIPDPRA